MAREINLRPKKPQPIQTPDTVTVRETPSAMEIASLRASIGELEGVVEQLVNREPDKVITEKETIVREVPVVQETIVLEDPRFTKLAADMGAIEKTLDQIKKRKPENVVVYGGNNVTSGGGAGVTDGDKGDIVVSGSGATWTIDPSVLTAQGRAIIDDANAGAQRTTLGLQGTGVGLAPAGGATSQVLAKVSNSDYDYAWASAGAGGGGTQYQEDTAAVSGDLGDLVLAVRRDADGTQVSTDGDYSELQTDASGFLKVIDKRSVYPINDNGGSITVDGAVTVSGTATVSGTVAATQSGTWTVQPGNTANTTAWKVDGSAVTQPVSGTVAATQSGAWSVSAAAALPVTDNSGSLTVDAPVATPVFVRLSDGASPISALPITDNSGSITVDGTVSITANSSVNMAQVAGTTTDTNSGVKSAGTLRVVLATDQPALTNKLLVTPDSVALPANQSVNNSQINGVTPLMGNGVTGTGSQRVTIASDNTAFSVNSTPKTATSGGMSVFHLVSAATTNATNLKASAGQVYGWYIYNSNAAARKVVFHNTAGTPTAGAGVIFALMIPPTSGANVFNVQGIPFATGIAITTVTDLTDAGTTAVAASDLIINIFFA